MNVLQYDLSVKIAKLTNAQKYRCWYNAYSALLQLPGLFPFSTYVEGWAVLPKEQEVVVLEHGWIEQSHGRVVDPSLVLLEKKDQQVHYFAGLQLDCFQLPNLEGIPLPIARLLEPEKNDLGPLEYKIAYDAAMQCAEELATKMGVPVQVYPGEMTLIMVSETGIVTISFER